MFERRLKVFLSVLLVLAGALVLRAAQVQVAERAEWTDLAARAMTQRKVTETTRGEIRDRTGRKIAIDKPCVDATVDYRALTPTPDARWVADVARRRLHDRHGDDYDKAPRGQRKAMLEEEVRKVRTDIEQMWPRLAKITGRPLEEIDEVRRGIVEKIKMRRRYVWYHNYEAAMKSHEKGVKDAATQPASVWVRWLLDEDQDAPDVDSFQLNVAEESEQHVILHDIDRDVQPELGKYSDSFPGFELRYSTHRIYPYEDVACHVLGRLTKVVKEDMRSDPDRLNDLRHYEPNDLIGRGGVEGMCERVMRGTRGWEERFEDRKVAARDAEPGRDVQVSIDIELQQEVQSLFRSVPVKWSRTADDREVPDRLAMHGAAVVIDVATGEVLAMVSAPTYDLNKLDEQYAALTSADNLHEPLLNRATQALREPGSTVKPMVGLAGVASNVRRVDEGYECIGYMVVNGHVYGRIGRCWVTSMWHNALCPLGKACTRRPCPAVAHHPIGGGVPHPTGFLTLPEALERSCNPYFESIAHALGPDLLSEWYKKFGLGRRTHIGIPEARGRVPSTDDVAGRSANTVFSTWTAGIGQGPVQATPLQMANVAATLARNGVWVRPRLLTGESVALVGPTTREPDRVDLQLPSDALRAVREGMVRVVNSKAGSGGEAKRADMLVAGKTGSAQASPLRRKVFDPVTKKQARDEKGNRKWEYIRPSTHSDPNPEAPWYRDTGREGSEQPTLTHSWFIGYAPANDPQVAFAVLIEYGGAGGSAAGSVAKDVIELCKAHGYLKLANDRNSPLEKVAASSAEGSGELLHDVR